MASVLSGRKICAVPRCLAERIGRAQKHGRFLFRYRWTVESIVIETVCAECGSTHSTEIAIPFAALDM